MTDYMIEIKGLYKGFNQENVLSNLNLKVPRGSVFGLLGTNGAGKTTLLKATLGLLHANAGTISVLNDNPWEFKEGTKEKIGYVPQSDRVYPWLTVRQLIEYTASFYNHWNHDLVSRLLEEWRVKMDTKYGLLSEGEAQKVALIIALGHEPELLILDEPVASLDPAARRQFLKMILDVVSERECTIFFSTHITSDLERVADSVAVLKDGQIEFCGELDQLKDEVKRLHIQVKSNLPKKFDIPGYLHTESSANEAVVSVRGYHEGVRKEIEEKLKAKVVVENLNLEEIFLELNR